MAEIKALTFKQGKQNIAALVCGDKDKPVLLCLHGWLDNAASFLPVMAKLHNRCVIAIDFPGHGKSDHRSSDAHYHFFDWVNDLFILVKKEGWQYIDIIGHSMGGMVALAFASAFPEKVKTLTLIDIAGFITADPSETNDVLRKSLLSREHAHTKKISYYQTLSAIIAARVYASDLSTEHATLLVKRSVLTTEKGFTWCYDRRLLALSPYRMVLSQAQQVISAIQAPVLLIKGCNGLALVEQGLIDFQPFFNEITCHTLQGGHHVHMEQPEKTAYLINQFIGK